MATHSPMAPGEEPSWRPQADCHTALRLSQPHVRRPFRSPMPTFTPASVMARTPRPNASKPSAARPAARWRTRRDYPLGDPARVAQNRLSARWRGAHGTGGRVGRGGGSTVFGHQHATSTTWLTRAGAHSMTLHQRVFHTSTCPTCNWMRAAHGCGAGRTSCGSLSRSRSSARLFRCST
jgi:hypothetical protein